MEEPKKVDVEAAAARLSSLLAKVDGAPSKQAATCSALAVIPAATRPTSGSADGSASQVMSPPAAGMQTAMSPVMGMPMAAAPMAADGSMTAAPMVAMMPMGIMMPMQVQQPQGQMPQQMQMQQQQMQMQMQMQQQMQMQMQHMQCQMLQMPGAGCQWPVMMPGATAMSPAALPSMAQRRATEDDAEIGPITSYTQEDIASMEHEVKEAEDAARHAAKEKSSYVGVMARYSEEEGYGFISCPDALQDWDRKDIFIASKNYANAKIKLGDTVIFQIEKDGKDLPRAASHPKTLKELTKQKKRLARMKELAKTDNIMKRSAAEMLAAPMGVAPGGFMTFSGVPEAKRINLGAGLQWKP